MGRRKAGSIVEWVALGLGVVVVAVLGYAGASALIDQRSEESGERAANGFLGGLADSVGEFFGKGGDGEGLWANIKEVVGKGSDGEGLWANLRGMFRKGD